MKMSKESYDRIAERFSENREVIKNHRHRLRKQDELYDNVGNLEVRLAFDAYRGLFTWQEQRDFREKDDLKDAHLQTALLKAMREHEI